MYNLKLTKDFKLTNDDFTILVALVNDYLKINGLYIDKTITHIDNPILKANYIDDAKSNMKLKKYTDKIENCIILGKAADYLRVYYGFDGVRYFKFLLEESYYYCDYNEAKGKWNLSTIDKKFLKKFNPSKNYNLNDYDINCIFDHMYDKYKSKKDKFKVSSFNNEFSEEDKLKFINKNKNKLKVRYLLRIKKMLNINVNAKKCYIIKNQAFMTNIFYGFDGDNFFKFTMPSALSYELESNNNFSKFKLTKDTLYGDDD